MQCVCGYNNTNRYEANTVKQEISECDWNGKNCGAENCTIYGAPITSPLFAAPKDFASVNSF